MERPLFDTITRYLDRRSQDNSFRKESRFERELFRDGKWVTKGEGYVYPRHIERFGNPQERTELLDQLYNDKTSANLSETRVADAIWSKRFSGKIPARWAIWYYIEQDFRTARERSVTLSPTLVDAGISHPDMRVVNEAGLGQKLDVSQLTLLFARRDFGAVPIDEILDAQRQMGVKFENIKIAKDKGESLREFMKYGVLECNKDQLDPLNDLIKQHETEIKMRASRPWYRRLLGRS